MSVADSALTVDTVIGNVPRVQVLPLKWAMKPFCGYATGSPDAQTSVADSATDASIPVLTGQVRPGKVRRTT